MLLLLVVLVVVLMEAVVVQGGIELLLSVLHLERITQQSLCCLYLLE
jgi:hypothetical protein